LPTTVAAKTGSIAAHAMHSFQLNFLLMKYTTRTEIIQPPTMTGTEDPDQGLPVLFDILIAELHCTSKALYNKDNPSALKHHVIHVSPSNWTENVRRERIGYDPDYERDIRFTKIAEFLECWIEYEG
jgi:hypothetical protein